MGPTRHPHEPLSHYRFRVAGYSFKWLMALAPRAVAHVGFWLPLLLPEGD